MKERNLYVCPKCHEWYSCDAKKNPQPCPNCRVSPIPVHVDYDYWQSLSQQQRDECKHQYMQEHQHEIDTSNSAYIPTKIKPRASITIVHVMGMLVMLACVCVGIASGPLGLLVGIIGGFASAAGLWVFAGMAEDLQALRQTVEDLSATLSQKNK